MNQNEQMSKPAVMTYMKLGVCSGVYLLDEGRSVWSGTVEHVNRIMVPLTPTIGVLNF